MATSTAVLLNVGSQAVLTFYLSGLAQETVVRLPQGTPTEVPGELYFLLKEQISWAVGLGFVQILAEPSGLNFSSFNQFGVYVAEAAVTKGSEGVDPFPTIGGANVVSP